MDGIRLGAGVTVAADAAPANWLKPRLLAWGARTGTRVGSVIPTGFSAYARVLHPARARRGDRSVLTWHEVARWAGTEAHAQMQWEAISRPRTPTLEPPPFAEAPEVGYCPSDMRRPLAERLARHTTTPGSCWVCVWEGFSGVGEAFPRAARVRLPGRDYILLSASIEAIADGVLLQRLGPNPGPNLWWPEDRAWCVSTEIDFCWTYVAGANVCIEDMFADERLEVFITVPEHRGDYGSDAINGPFVPY